GLLKILPQNHDLEPDPLTQRQFYRRSQRQDPCFNLAECFSGSVGAGDRQTDRAGVSFGPGGAAALARIGRGVLLTQTNRACAPRWRVDLPLSSRPRSEIDFLAAYAKPKD